jgi:hypothetical protein
MAHWLRLMFRVGTLAVAAVAIAALLPFVGQPAPALGQFGGGFGGFSGTCPGFGFGGIGGFGGCSFGSGFSGGFGGGGFGAGFGGFAVATPHSTVAVGESLPLIFGWVVPPPGTWRDLSSLDVRLRDQHGVALWLRWEEKRNTLTLIDPATGEPKGPRRSPGGKGRLHGTLATLEVGDSAVEDSGVGGDSVALLLPVRFAPAAGARTYLLEVGAGHDNGELFFATASKVTVRPR